jgi:hypothetical protein
LKLAQTNNEKLFEGLTWIQLGGVTGKMEKLQLHKAEDCILKGMKKIEELKVKPSFPLGFLSFGELYAHAGQKGKALEDLEKAEEHYQEMGMDYWLTRTRKLLETVQ